LTLKVILNSLKTVAGPEEEVSQYLENMALLKKL